MRTTDITRDHLPELGELRLINAQSVRINLCEPPKKFYRHGWQSWSLTTWLDPADPPRPVRAVDFCIKDEDPGYAHHLNHVKTIERVAR